jgi:Arc/MetJ-type ribon-helix-helix transcriptional regulator
MTAKKITISVPEEVLDRVMAAVERGDAESISGYFTDAASRRTAAEAWVAEDVRRHGPVEAEVLELARRTLLTGELVEQRDPKTGGFIRVVPAGEAAAG